MTMAQVRYFAGAAEAARTEAEALTGTSVAELRACMVEAHGEAFARVLERCSILVEGVRSDDDAPVAPGDVVDVLPPFAGG